MADETVFLIPAELSIDRIILLAIATSTILSACGSLLLLPLMRRVALDLPNERSTHQTPTPRGGGLAVVCALVSTVIVIGWPPGRDTSVILGAILALAGLGIADDLYGLPETRRIVTQTAIGVSTGAVLTAAQYEGGIETFLVIAVSTLWIVGYTNAFNFMDGINGISGVTALVAGAWFAWLSYGVEELLPVSLLAGALLGAALGFLPLNFPGAKLFLGDAGSYALGGAIACLSVLLINSGVSVLASIAPALLYVADTGWVLIVRALRGERWWTAHRRHVYQRLVDQGADARVIALMAGMISALVCLVTELPVALPGQLALIAVIVLGYLFSPQVQTWNRQ